MSDELQDMQDMVAKLLDEIDDLRDELDDRNKSIEHLRGALSGRTMSCSLCNDAARKQDVLIDQMASISAANAQHVQNRQNLLDAVRQLVTAKKIKINPSAKRCVRRQAASEWRIAWSNLLKLLGIEDETN